MLQPITRNESSRTIHAAPESGSASAPRITFPFSAVVGHHTEKRALLLLAVDPRLRGVLIATTDDSAKSTLARSFGSVLPREDNREWESASLSAGGDLYTIQLPINITDDRLLGGLDLEQTLATGKRQVSPGLLAQAHGRVLYVADVHLLLASTVAHVAHALERRRVPLEREGVSAIHEADFMILGTFNPAEGEPSALLRDRIALIVNSTEESSPDERMEMIARTLGFDNDPSSFPEDFAFETAEIKSAIENARARLSKVGVSNDQVRQIALVAMRLGVEGNRADVFALKAARANAALAGRDAVNEEDLIVAIQLVLAPRATIFPSAKEEVERDEESRAQEPADEGQAPESSDRDREPLSGSIEDLLLEAIDARVPEEALSAAQRTARSARAGTGKRFKSSKSTRGRYVSSVARRNRDARVAVDATLRAAAPFQLRRRTERELTIERLESERSKELPTDGPARRVKIRPDDLRFKQFKHRSGILFILAVDSSGSMAFNRMAQAKGALTRLLQQAYLHRDKVSLISFRGAGAEVLLEPTRSVELAKRLLDALPAGGGTPLSAGVVKAIELARLARLKGIQQAMLVLFTDGRANVPLPGDRTPFTASAIEDELRRLGALLGAEEITSVVVDTKSRFVSNGEGDTLARMLGARYVYLPRSDAAMLHKAIVSAAPGKREQR
jgi:magnesium chelatase subunit D